MDNTLSLGLDIGTTSISAVAVDTRNGKVLDSRTVKNGADIPSTVPGEKCQSPRVIRETVGALLEQLLKAFPNIGSIGITGQMHGILYLDEAGEAVSPLYTWQDQRGAPLCPKLEALTGYPTAPGYGLATHCALMAAGEVPETGKRICTVMDYIGLSLTEEKQLWMHSTNAAGLGFFRLREGGFDEEALGKLGISPGLLPDVTGSPRIIGHFREIPVAIAIGDNQASFLGSVADPETVALANFGTGSQISLQLRGGFSAPPGLEVRPMGEDSVLICGSALCGGRAYALLERFFHSFAEACGFSGDAVYDRLNRMALEGLRLETLPEVLPTFCGTRSDPGVTASVTGLREDNFTPEALTAGLLLGMAQELFRMYTQMPGNRVSRLAASGNAVRKNPALKQALERVFSMEVLLPEHREEAAFGAALFGAAAAQGRPPEVLAKQCVRYAGQ